MYGGATLPPNQGPGGMGMSNASPIPQQWWDQDNGNNGPPPPPPPQQHGMSAMDVAVANNSYRNNLRGQSPNVNQRFQNMHMSGGPPEHMDDMNHQQQHQQPHQSYGHGPGQGQAQAHYSPSPNRNQMRMDSGRPVEGNSRPNGMAAPGPTKGPSSNGLIRLTLKKPMGIVFEPMEDPHNPSQQRGVRICDLPRTGSAAVSGMLEVGDELLSINNKPMSRLTFDEIMDFIIEADAENVDLLFRRPKKEKNARAPQDANKNISSVKWRDGTVEAEVIVANVDDVTVEDSPPGGKGKRYGSPSRRDEESIYSADDTFYTEQTSYTEDTRKSSRRRGKRRNRRYESESFLDMLIDTVCAPVMGGGDKRGDYSDDDMTFNSAEDGTYASLDESYYTLEERKKKWQESKRKRKERDKKSLAEEKKKSEERQRSPEPREPMAQNFEPEQQQGMPPQNGMDNGMPMLMQDDQYGHMPPGGPYSPENNVEYVDQQKPEILAMPNHQSNAQPPPMPSSPPRHDSHAHPSRRDGRDGNSPRRPIKNSPQPMAKNSPRIKASDRFEPQAANPPDNNDSLEQDPNMPFKEIEYDDNVDGEVSVMESVGGPSLLLENLRNAAKMERTVSADIVANFGKDFKPQLGLTREETIQMNPNEFYHHVVKTMLEENEPEKVRLMDKLFAKYGGREEHLIRKLDARYVKNNIQKSESDPKSGSSDGAYDGFKAFGGGNDFSSGERSEENEGPERFDGGNAWQEVPSFHNKVEHTVPAPPPNYGNEYNDQNQGRGEDASHSSYSESDTSSIDGTSPEVIAQVSELLNYVYGKTTVAGQIDRVSTIMRAYEGREAVLLELLETKALLKANSEKGGLDDLPESLRDNPGLQQPHNEVQVSKQESNVMSPISNMSGPSGQASAVSMQSMENTSVGQSYGQAGSSGQGSIGNSTKTPESENPFDLDNHRAATPPHAADMKKKKKGMFKGMFKKKNKKGAFPSSRGKKGALLGAD